MLKSWHQSDKNFQTVSLVEQAIALGAKSPLELDKVLRHMGLEPRLVNPFLATKVSYLGHKYLYIPIQISDDPGGRRSIYFLNTSEEAPTGFIIPLQEDSDQILVRWIERISGNGKAKTGDQYIERIRYLNGEVLAECKCELEVLDEEKGLGRFKQMAAPFATITPFGRVWIGWSLILIEW